MPSTHQHHNTSHINTISHWHIHTQRGFTIVIILVLIALWNCKSTEKKPESTKDLESFVKETLGVDNVIEINQTKTYALCQQKRQADHWGRKFRYMVVRLSDHAVVHEGIFSMGYVKWLDNDSIEVFSESNSGREENSTKKIIHVNSPFQ